MRGEAGAPSGAEGRVRKYVRRLRGLDHFPVQKGTAVSRDRLRGYYIDLTRKAATAPSTPHELAALPLHVMTCQWGLGCYERYLAGDGDGWLDAAVRIGRYLVGAQERGGPQAGAWRHDIPFPHTFHLPPGWISGMAQGEGASLLARLYVETEDDAFADAAARALRVLDRDVEDGGVRRSLNGGPIHEEYPTDPPSHVLNGAIFAAWGYHDAALALDSAEHRTAFDAVATTLADNLHRWDLGFWSRYDLYPHRIRNAAAPWYHRLHIQQLEVLATMTHRGEFGRVADRWRRYAASPWKRNRALLHKVAFRIAIPL